MKRALALALLLTGVATAYYPWVRYNSRTGVYQPAPSKFDLNRLANKTVYYFIADNGPVGLLPNDSVAAIRSQIRSAAAVWNSVETSDIRIAFGGLRAASAPVTATPRIDVLFEELPPGVLSQGGPVLEEDGGAAAEQSFIPILRSVVILPRDFPAISAPCPCPSWSDQFFTTAVHEFGHALGLQHSFASGVMSQIVTRATTKARPLAADDIAGISWLYPSRAFRTMFGSISGRVTNGGAGVAHASVVALSPSGAAVNALTNPDGTYQIDGLPAGQYIVYTHALPPGADVRAALDADRHEIPFPQAFDTVFYPGTRNWTVDGVVPVREGEVRDNVNFSVATRRAPLGIHNLWTYGFPTGQVAVHPGHVSLDPSIRDRNFVLAYGAGLLGAGNQLAPGLSVSTVVGGSTLVTGVRPYEPNPQFIRIDLQFSLGTNEGAHHLVFQTPNDTFVLPAAFTVVRKVAPAISSVTPGADAGGRFLAVAGTGLTPETRILLDGVTAASRGFDNGRLLVTLPPGPPGHQATVIAANPDGQTSLFSQPAPFTYTYEAEAAAPSVLVTSQATFPAGVEALVEITGLNTRFAEGQVQAGFHTSDAVVRRLWVVSPTRLLANIWVAPGAAAGLLPLTVTSGLSTIHNPAGLLVTPASGQQLSLTPASAPAGTTVPVVVRGSLNGATVTATINDRPAAIVGVNGNVVLVQIPAGLPVGPAALHLTVGGEQSLPIALSIQPPPPVIIAAFSNGNVLIDGNRPARPNETVRLMVQGLSETAQVAQARVSLNVAGQDQAVTQIVAMGGAGGHEVHFLLGGSIPNGVAITTVTIDGRTSAPFALPVRQ